MGENQNRVAIYVRVSTVHQIDRGSIPMQKKDLVAYSHLILGTDNYVIYEDAGYSGKNTDRPKFQEMMARIRAGAFTHLLVWKIDRISRNLLDFAAMYAELKRLGVIFVSKNEQFDTSTAMGEAMLKIILVFAELERNMTSERVTATMISRANSGLWNGGRIPYGYCYNSETKEFSPNPEESDTAILIHDKYEEIRSLVRESRYLNSIGLRTRAGNEWNPVSLSIILHNVFYCGDYRYNRLKEGSRQQPKDKAEWITVKDHHPALVSREQKERIIHLLDKNSRLARERNVSSDSKSFVHVFGGLVFCGNCGRLMNSSPNTRRQNGIRYTRYSCPQKRRTGTDCLNPSVTDITVGEFVFNYVLNMLNAQKHSSAFQSPKDLQDALLFGDTFSCIESIEESGLTDLFMILRSGVAKGPVYGKGITIEKHDESPSEVDSLLSEKKRIERALDRLRNLYIFEDSTMTEMEYFVQRSKLEEQLQDIMERIGMLTTSSFGISINDEQLVRKASEFIIAKKLQDRQYISYTRLMEQADAKALKEFVLSIIDNITVKNGVVTGIVFRNGLSHRFIVRNSN